MKAEAKKKQEKIVIDSGKNCPVAYSRSSVAPGEILLSHQCPNQYCLFSWSSRNILISYKKYLSRHSDHPCLFFSVFLSHTGMLLFIKK